MVQAEPQLTPFMSTIEAAVAGALYGLLGIPETVPLRWDYYVPDDCPWMIHVAIGTDNPLRLEFGPGERTDTWFQGRTFNLSIRHLRGQRHPLEDPEVRRLVGRLSRRLSALEAEVADGLFSAFWSAVENYTRFKPIGDWMYRQASGFEAVVRLGFRCNQDCSFCWQDRQWPEPPSQYYYRWLDDFAAAGHTAVTFSGGEPTMHPELPALIEYAKQKHNMTVWLQTNAIRLNNERYLDTLIQAGLSHLFVSYHSQNPDISDRMTRAPRTHRLTEKGIQASLAHGLSVNLNCVVERQNFEDLSGHAQHVIDAFIRPWPDNPVRSVSYSHPCHYFDPEDWKAALVPLDEQRPHLVDAIHSLQAEGVWVECVGTCGFPPCVFKDEPGLLKGTINDVTEGSQDTLGRVYGESCEACAMRSDCLGIRSEYLDIHGERGLQPFKEVVETTDEVHQARAALSGESAPD